jgi:hypothetical protein
MHPEGRPAWPGSCWPLVDGWMLVLAEEQIPTGVATVAGIEEEEQI